MLWCSRVTIFLHPQQKKLLELCKQKPGKDKAAAQATQQEARQEAISSGDGDSQIIPLKKIKLEPEGTSSTCDHSNTGVWLQHKIQLSLKEKNILSDGYQLNDKHINFAQFILKEKFPNVNGLQLTLLQTKFKLIINTSFVQILHIHGDHWITISNLQCDSGKILIYDSVFITVDSQDS